MIGECARSNMLRQSMMSYRMLAFIYIKQTKHPLNEGKQGRLLSPVVFSVEIDSFIQQ